MGGEKLVACMLVTVLSLTLMRSVYGQHMPEEPCSVQILVPGLKGTANKLHHIMSYTLMTLILMLCSPRLRLFYKKYSKNYNIMKCYYSLK